MSNTDTCPYDDLPLKPIILEDGDELVWHGYPMAQCKKGHRFVYLPRERDEDQPQDSKKA